MTNDEYVDVTFDFRSDSTGPDPDSLRGGSATLRRYHQKLWSKPLPGGIGFVLDASTPGEYLHHKSEIGEFALSSDSLIHTYDYGYRGAVKVFTDQLSAPERESFERATYTIGGMLIFPSNRVDGLQTINQARGTNGSIKDRFDLTLECVRLAYAGETSPLEATLRSQQRFFELFADFPGYVNFFYLQDMVANDYSVVRFSLPFDGFEQSPLPSNMDDYLAYRCASLAFIAARNARIAQAFD